MRAQQLERRFHDVPLLLKKFRSMAAANSLKGASVSMRGVT
jgi:hypothetical protein